MGKFQTHAGPKSADEIVAELVPGRKPEAQVFAATRTDDPAGPDVEELGPSRFRVQDSAEVGFLGSKQPVVVPTGPQGATGFPCSPPGANGPAGHFQGTAFLPNLIAKVPTGPASSPNLPLERDRAEVDLRQAIRRCFKEGVPLDRMVEIFRLELVDVVHDD